MTIIPKALDYTGINMIIGTKNVQSPNLKSHTVNGRCFLEPKQRKGGNQFISHHIPISWLWVRCHIEMWGGGRERQQCFNATF